MHHYITYAKDKFTGEIRRLTDVSRGLACNCVCPSCGEALEACKGEKRKYFRHHSLKECKGAFESQLHLISKHIIEQNKAVMLPMYQGKYDTDEALQLHFTEVIKESSQGDLQPDCLCKYLDREGKEHTLWIEILNTHEVDEPKAQKIRERGIECVEIDVSHLFEGSNVIDEEVLKDFLLNKTENRKWINNTYCDGKWLKQAEIVRSMDIVAYLAYMSDDENNIDAFKKTMYALFDTGYLLEQKDYNDFYGVLKKYRYNIRSQEKWLQRRYLSALQMLLCHLSMKGMVRGTNKSKDELLQICAFARNHFEEKLDDYVRDVLTWGMSLYRTEISSQVSRRPIYGIGRNRRL